MSEIGGAVAGVVGGVTGALGFGAEGSRYSREGAEASAEANRLKNMQAKVTAQRQREQDIAKVRSAKASMLTAAAATGSTESSSYEGSSGALTSELTSNIGYGTQMQAIQDQIVEYENKAIMAGNQASEAQQTAGLFSEVAGIAAGFLL